MSEDNGQVAFLMERAERAGPSCSRCGKTISENQTVVLIGSMRQFCLNCAMYGLAEDESVAVSVDLLRRLRDGVLY